MDLEELTSPKKLLFLKPAGITVDKETATISVQLEIDEDRLSEFVEKAISKMKEETEMSEAMANLLRKKLTHDIVEAIKNADYNNKR